VTRLFMEMEFEMEKIMVWMGKRRV